MRPTRELRSSELCLIGGPNTLKCYSIVPRLIECRLTHLHYRPLGDVFCVFAIYLCISYTFLVNLLTFRQHLKIMFDCSSRSWVVYFNKPLETVHSVYLPQQKKSPKIYLMMGFRKNSPASKAQKMSLQLKCYETFILVQLLEHTAEHQVRT